MGTTGRLIGGFLLVATLFAAALYLTGQSDAVDIAADRRIISIPSPTAMDLRQAAAREQAFAVPPAGRVVAGIVPHHLLVAPLMSAWFSHVRPQSAPGTVVIIGPDHENAGVGPVTTTARTFSTATGTIDADAARISALRRDDLAAIDDRLLAKENSVGAVIPLVRTAWPQAKVLPLLVRGNAPAADMQRLAAWLNRTLDEHDLVIASVDFSHYKNLAETRADDAVSIPAVMSGDPARVEHIAADSPLSLMAVLAYARMRGATPQKLVHTNSAEFEKQAAASSMTSYLTAYFVR